MTASGQTTMDLVPRLVFDRAEPGVLLDLHQLRETRMFIGGGSGSGKSILIRYTAEAWAKTLVQLHVDWEGDYVTLREIHHYIWIGAVEDGADLQVSEATARRDCRNTIGLGFSVILDLSGIDDDVEKRRIAGLWCDEIIRRKWDGLIVYVDEAQEFAPEKGKTEEYPSSLPLRRLVARGRRLGVFVVTASQRIAETHKRLLEVGNRVFGPTTLDVDVDRVAKVLDLSKQQKMELQTIKPCTYFAKGRAIGNGTLTLVRAGEVKSSHPDPLSIPLKPPATPKEMAKALKALRSEKYDDPDQASKQELQELVQRLEAQIEDLKSGRGTEGVIASAVAKATAPLNDEIHALRLKVERQLNHARMILLDAGELPPENHGNETNEEPRDRPRSEQLEPKGMEERLLEGASAGEPNSPNRTASLGLEGGKSRTVPVARGRGGREGKDRAASDRRAGRSVASLQASAQERFHALLPKQQSMVRVLENRAKPITSQDLARAMRMGENSSSFRKHRKAIVDAGFAVYSRRGWIQAATEGNRV